MPNPINEILKGEDLRWQVGKIIWDRYLGPACLDFAVGTNSQDLATAWLGAMGFTQVSWLQVEDDTLLLYLWYVDEGQHDHEFILAFEGTDARRITIFNQGKSADA